jgi:hypothetical protein
MQVVRMDENSYYYNLKRDLMTIIGTGLSSNGLELALHSEVRWISYFLKVVPLLNMFKYYYTCIYVRKEKKCCLKNCKDAGVDGGPIR